MFLTNSYFLLVCNFSTEINGNGTILLVYQCFISQLAAEKSLDTVSYFHFDSRDETASQWEYVCFISHLTAEKPLDRVIYFLCESRDETASQWEYVCFISHLTAEKPLDRVIYFLCESRDETASQWEYVFVCISNIIYINVKYIMLFKTRTNSITVPNWFDVMPYYSHF